MFKNVYKRWSEKLKALKTLFPTGFYGICSPLRIDMTGHNITSSTKPELHNISPNYQRRTKNIWPEVALHFYVVSEICKRTVQQTDRHTHHNISLLSRRRSYAIFIEPLLLTNIFILSARVVNKERKNSMNSSKNYAGCSRSIDEAEYWNSEHVWRTKDRLFY